MFLVLSPPRFYYQFPLSLAELSSSGSKSSGLSWFTIDPKISWHHIKTWIPDVSHDLQNYPNWSIITARMYLTARDKGASAPLLRVSGHTPGHGWDSAVAALTLSSHPLAAHRWNPTAFEQWHFFASLALPARLRPEKMSWTCFVHPDLGMSPLSVHHPRVPVLFLLSPPLILFSSHICSRFPLCPAVPHWKLTETSSPTLAFQLIFPPALQFCLSLESVRFWCPSEVWVSWSI